VWIPRHGLPKVDQAVWIPRLRFLAALAAGFLVLTKPSPAMAQPTIPAAAPEPTDDDLIAEGVALRKAGRDAEALAEFERAYSLRRSARAAGQIAIAHEALGHWKEAEAGLLAVLGNAADPWVTRHSVYLEDSLAAVEAHLAWLEVESNVAGTEVWVGGELSGRLPLDRALRVVSGEVAVEVRAPGYAAIRRALHVDAKSHIHEAFLFVRQQAAEQAPAGEASTPPRGLAPPLPVAHPRAGVRAAGWITLAGAGGLLLVGVAGAVIREWEAQLYDDDSRCAPLGGESRYDRCGTNRNIGSTAQAVAVVSFVGSGIAAAVSGALLLGSGRSAPSNASPVPEKRVGCGFIGIGFGCGGAF
jgi:tetratricopeptide (TPR) repeat protein